jgi:FemAB-related protein (PEP-CTERM system-associated)
MLMPLADLTWESLDRKVRNQIRKAQKSNLTLQRGGIELLPEFYRVFARNMRDLGTPVYPPQWFAEILRAFPERATITVVRLAARPVAAGLTFRTRGTMEIPWASSVRDVGALCPNHLLYWDILQRAGDEGCTMFDFGRSTPGEGTFKFKEQWGASPVALHWEYPFLANGEIPDSTPKNPKFQLAIAVWKKLPLIVANGIGPHIVRAIP